MLSNISIRFNINYIYNYSEEDNEFFIIEELLSSVGKLQVWQQSGLSGKQVTGGSEGNLEGAAKNDGNSVTSPGWSEGVYKDMYISSTHHRR